MLQSSVLPKLLAKENITIQHGNYKTAWFDVKNRVLGLPMWKDMGKDVYDLLVGHEVSHALHTPFEGWHDSPEKLEGAPRSYLNVVEDARIERFIKDIYPGLVGPMARGYRVLYDRKFFGDLDSLNWDEVKLIDKLNIKAKLAHLQEVPLNAEEEVFLDRMMKTQTFDEVVELAKDILKYTKENQPELLEPVEQEQDNSSTPQDSDDPTSSGHDDQEVPQQEKYEEEQSSTPGQEGEDGEEGEEGSASGEEGEDGEGEEASASGEEDGEGEEEGSEEGEGSISANPEYSEEDVSRTDEALRRNESQLLDIDEAGEQPTLIQDIKKEAIDIAVIPYSKLKEDRPKGDDFDTAKYKEYVKKVKKSVNFAVKEFEQKKSAYQWTRAQTAKTGRIDVNKLWSYKTSEDIFAQMTTLADAKNHGMILIVDFSGSMSNSMTHVMDQLMHLVLFCKQVNIPFEVYGFTSTNPGFRRSYDRKTSGFKNAFTYTDGDLNMDGLSMPLICSSSLKKADFEDSLQHIYTRKTTTSYWSHNLSIYEEWGSTPLNQALVVAHTLVKNFKKKHNVQKMNLVTFTDGEANGMSAVQDYKLEAQKFGTKWNKFKMIIDGKMVNIGSKQKATKKLLQNIAKRYNTKTIGFFMADQARHWRDRLYVINNDVNGYDYDADREFKKQAAKEYRKNKCVQVDNCLGYDKYYLLKGGKTLKAEDKDFVTTGAESDAQLRTAFKSYAKDKKLSKVLMTSFGKEVA